MSTILTTATAHSPNDAFVTNDLRRPPLTWLIAVAAAVAVAVAVVAVVVVVAVAVAHYCYGHKPANSCK